MFILDLTWFQELPDREIKSYSLLRPFCMVNRIFIIVAQPLHGMRLGFLNVTDVQSDAQAL